ncbi:hypothetical protein ACOSQ3_020502 [Xanthoceras sorbifolium]
MMSDFWFHLHPPRYSGFFALCCGIADPDLKTRIQWKNRGKGARATFFRKMRRYQVETAENWGYAEEVLKGFKLIAFFRTMEFGISALCIAELELQNVTGWRRIIVLTCRKGGEFGRIDQVIEELCIAEIKMQSNIPVYSNILDEFVAKVILDEFILVQLLEAASSSYDFS